MPDQSENEVLYSAKNDELEYIYELALNEGDAETTAAGFYADLDDAERYGECIRINGGGMKDIYRVVDRKTRRYVAMACLKSRNSADEKDLFLREANLTASLVHPNIMPVYDVGSDNDEAPFFTMKLTGGNNLGQLLKEQGGSWVDWPMLQRLNLFLSICEGMAYAHSRHILHLDLKPANIQVGEFGEVLICDWGLGRVLFDEITTDEAKKSLAPMLFNEIVPAGFVKGTPGFMAPELKEKGAESCTRETDIYALGGILRALLQGSSVPRALHAVVMKAMDEDPAKRYNSVEDLKGEINAYINGFATAAEDAGFFRLLLLLIKRNRVITGALALILILCAIFVVRLQMSEREATRLLKLYTSEKKERAQLRGQTLPKLLELADLSLQTFEFQRCRELLDAAMLLDKTNPELWVLSGRLHFYNQEFNAALAAFAKSPDGRAHPLYKRALELGKTKPDNERLSKAALVELVKSFKSFGGDLRIFMHNERKNYEDLATYLTAVHAVYELVNPKNETIHFEFQQIDGKNVLDLSGNPTFSKPKLELLEDLPIHRLNIEDLPIGFYDTRSFRNMALEEANLALPIPVSLSFVKTQPNLKKLILRKGKYRDEQLRRLRKHCEVILK